MKMDFIYTNLIDVKHIKGIINNFRPINLDEMNKSFPLFFSFYFFWLFWE